MLHYGVDPKDGVYYWKVYHYDATTDTETLIKSDGPYTAQGEARDTAAKWVADNGINATYR